jgi:GH24 family phage-related lysozyme (muramidase)
MTQFYTGVVEDRTTDPLKLGRCKVRIFGLHSENKQQLPTADLPWAIVMQPVTSAAMSGIGFSPVGPVEGSWVVVMFTDEDNQQPVIMGTLGGIPQQDTGTNSTYSEQSNTVKSTDGTAVTDSSGAPILTGETTPATPVTSTSVGESKKASSLSLSAEGLTELKSHEGLASLDKSVTRIGKDSTPAKTTLFPYKDTKGIWTIGWGSTYLLDDSRVNANTIISKEDADKLLMYKLEKEFVPAVKRKLKVPVTQSMFDSIVGMVYNMGAVGFFNSQIGTTLNAGDYAAAAAFIPLTRNNKGTLTGRREKEKTLFLKDGIPSVDGEVTPTPVTPAETKTAADTTKNPVVIRNNSAPPITQNLNPTDESGFKDPNKAYPKWINEPDTHRLARNESIDKTVVFSKEAGRVLNVKKADGSTWNQPPIPYNTKYPFNHVFATESGHIEEWDDTKGSERRHSFHKSGTFYEIDSNGTLVTRIVGDNFEILERNGNLLVKGQCNVTIQGNSNVRIENDSIIQVLGNATLNVTGNLTQAVSGDYKVKVGGQFAVDASKVYFNSGVASGVSLPTEAAPDAPEFGVLTTTSRTSDVDANYETPQEGNSEAFVASNVSSGVVNPEETAPTTTPTTEEAVVPEKTANPSYTTCGEDIKNATVFTAGFKLTEQFTLGQICTGDSGIPSGVNYGISAADIVCNLRLLVSNCIEPIKAKYPNIIIKSAWRSEAHNTRIKGSKTSDHLKGMAIDFILGGFNRKQHYDAIIEIQKMLPAFRQLILEYKGATTWIHIAFNINNNLMQALTIDAAKNETLRLASGKNGYVLKE